MKSHATNQQETDNQDIEMTEGFGGDNNAPETDSATTDNMADTGDTVAENDTQTTPLSADEEAAIWKDKFVRLSAEYENYRKRTYKEKLDLVAAGGEDVLRSMLEVVDDMDRALEAIAKTDDATSIKQGIALIDTKLRGALKGHGLAEIEAIGCELDTDLHEAVARIEAQDAAMKGKIIDVVQKGYKLKEKIIRYAKVVVGQ
jgi:molecular chaperone GrpE